MHLFSVYFKKTSIRNGAKMGPLKALTYKLYHLRIHYVIKRQEDRSKIVLGKYASFLCFVILAINEFHTTIIQKIKTIIIIISGSFLAL